jgi:hypothetical protein
MERRRSHVCWVFHGVFRDAQVHCELPHLLSKDYLLAIGIAVDHPTIRRFPVTEFQLLHLPCPSIVHR